jgi:hypothetical protein
MRQPIYSHGVQLLLDESLPHDLVGYLEGHEVRTVDQMGWKGTKNGLNAATRRFGGQLGSRGYAELCEDVGEVDFRGAAGDE